MEKGVHFVFNISTGKKFRKLRENSKSLTSAGNGNRQHLNRSSYRLIYVLHIGSGNSFWTTNFEEQPLFPTVGGAVLGAENVIVLRIFRQEMAKNFY
jgi:hypothetical protein